MEGTNPKKSITKTNFSSEKTKDLPGLFQHKKTI